MWILTFNIFWLVLLSNSRLQPKHKHAVPCGYKYMQKELPIGELGLCVKSVHSRLAAAHSENFEKRIRKTIRVFRV